MEQQSGEERSGEEGSGEEKRVNRIRMRGMVWIALVALGLVGQGCTVDRSRTADPAEVPTASALGCADGQVVEWRDGAWGCASPGAADDTLAGLDCAGGQVAKWDDRAGEWACDDDLQTDPGTDTLAGLGCAGGQVAKWDDDAGEWACGDDLQTDPGTDSLAAVGACVGGQVLEWGDEGWACGEDAASATDLVATDARVRAVEDEVEAASGGQVSLDARLVAMDARMAAIEARLVVLEEALCPPGFTYVAEGDYDVCQRTFWGVTDEMVKVGGFWIDRYELSQCSDGEGLGDVTGATTATAACSVEGVTPQGSITWFQAAQMCANAGKRLCTNAEWQTAASGTPDPGANGGVNGCNVSSDGTPAETRGHTACVSTFGAFDMAGNLWEWVADWHGKDSATNGLTSDATYGSDYMYDVSPADIQGAAGQDFPAAALRGGGWGNGTGAGAFALSLDYAPSYASTSLGARCCAGGR